MKRYLKKYFKYVIYRADETINIKYRNVKTSKVMQQ